MGKGGRPASAVPFDASVIHAHTRPRPRPHAWPARSKSNPQAFANVLRRMLEAAGRGMWNADAQTLEQLQRMYADMDDQLEGVQPGA